MSLKKTFTILDAFTVKENDNYNLIALQGLDTNEIEGCEFLKK